jgi:hypothetical protein
MTIHQSVMLASAKLCLHLIVVANQSTCRHWLLFCGMHLGVFLAWVATVQTSDAAVVIHQPISLDCSGSGRKGIAAPLYVAAMKQVLSKHSLVAHTHC